MSGQARPGRQGQQHTCVSNSSLPLSLCQSPSYTPTPLFLLLHHADCITTTYVWCACIDRFLSTLSTHLSHTQLVALSCTACFTRSPSNGSHWWFSKCSKPHVASCCLMLHPPSTSCSRTRWPAARCADTNSSASCRWCFRLLRSFFAGSMGSHLRRGSLPA
jgi:hypothetical protein